MWFDSTIESTSTESNPFFIIRGKFYTGIQFESKPNPYISSLISQEPYLSPHVEGYMLPFCTPYLSLCTMSTHLFIENIVWTKIQITTANQF